MVVASLVGPLWFWRLLTLTLTPAEILGRGTNLRVIFSFVLLLTGMTEGSRSMLTFLSLRANMAAISSLFSFTVDFLFSQLLLLLLVEFFLG